MATPLKYLLNPCDIDRHLSLAPIGDALHRLWTVFTAGTTCTCCLAGRLVGAALGAGLLGYTIGALT